MGGASTLDFGEFRREPNTCLETLFGSHSAGLFDQTLPFGLPE